MGGPWGQAMEETSLIKGAWGARPPSGKPPQGAGCSVCPEGRTGPCLGLVDPVTLAPSPTLPWRLFGLLLTCLLLLQKFVAFPMKP